MSSVKAHKIDTIDPNPVLLSLIIPIRQSYDRLTALLATFDAASLSDLEVIVVRDHDDPPPADFTPSADVRVVVTDTVGLGPARNFGLTYATGRFVAFCDGDDVLDLPRLLDLTHRMEQADCDLALATYEKLHNDGTVTQHDPSGGLPAGVVTDFVDRARMSRGFYFCWNKVYRRAFLTNTALTFPKGEYEDVFWSVLAIAQANQILVSDQSFYGYRQVSNSAVNRSGAQHLDIVRQYRDAISAMSGTDIPASFARAVWTKATRHILFVICGTNRLSTQDRAVLFGQLCQNLRSGPGLWAVARETDISLFNRIAILLGSPRLLDLKRMVSHQR
jgi:CDP-glycerol glycerophosphotransferase